MICTVFKGVDMTKHAHIGIALGLLSGVVSGCYSRASLGTNGQVSSDDCAVYAAIAKSELLFKKNGVIELPAPPRISCDWGLQGIRLRTH